MGVLSEARHLEPKGMNCFAHTCIKGSLLGANSSCFIDNYVYYATTLPHRNLSASSKTPLPPLKPLPLLQNPPPPPKPLPLLQNPSRGTGAGGGTTRRAEVASEQLRRVQLDSWCTMVLKVGDWEGGEGGTEGSNEGGRRGRVCGRMLIWSSQECEAT